eukprot:TRINITY_DN3909_c0_g1_i1.p2 TRINITY_DN3909_c0_g1~~TRINITY_DN3909_c0_g1_i1.p2  ORF type:complete len:155 (-),score=21.79 TRINITY_DN3909_c0_g1_i1:194-658(-)
MQHKTMIIIFFFLVQSLLVYVESKESIAIKSFKKADSDNDGSVSESELEAFLGSLGVEIPGGIEILLIDSDNDEAVSLSEFSSYVGMALSNPTSIQQFYEFSDTNNDDCLDAVEFEKLLNKLGEKDTGDLFVLADADGDGCLSLVEFSELVKVV